MIGIFMLVIRRWASEAMKASCSFIALAPFLLGPQEIVRSVCFSIYELKSRAHAAAETLMNIFLTLYTHSHEGHSHRGVETY